MHLVRRIGARAREYGWALADQVLSSGTNFAVTVIVARSVGPFEFGGFVLSIAIWMTILGFGRSLVMQPYVLKVAAKYKDISESETRNAAGVAISLGTISGMVLLISGLLLGRSDQLGQSLIVIGLFAGPLMLQEFWRVAAFSRREPRAAFSNDIVWAGTQIALLFFFSQTGSLGRNEALVSWGLGAVAGACFGVWQFRLIPRLSNETLSWFIAALRVGGWFGASGAVFALGEQGAIWGIGSLAGLQALGGLRSVDAIFGPAKLFAIATESVTLPRVVSAKATNGHAGVIRACAVYSAVLVMCFVVYLSVLLLLGDSLLGAVFGSEFMAYSELVLPLGLAAIFGAVVSGASIGLRAGQQGRALVVGQIPSTAVKLTLVLYLASGSGALGAAWAFALAAGILSCTLWVLLWKGLPFASTPLVARGEKMR